MPTVLAIAFAFFSVICGASGNELLMKFGSVVFLILGSYSAVISLNAHQLLYGFAQWVGEACAGYFIGGMVVGGLNNQNAGPVWRLIWGFAAAGLTVWAGYVCANWTVATFL